MSYLDAPPPKILGIPPSEQALINLYKLSPSDEEMRIRMGMALTASQREGQLRSRLEDIGHQAQAALDGHTEALACLNEILRLTRQLPC